MSRANSTRPRGRSGYSMKRHGQSSRQGLTGDYTVKKGVADVWRPSWSGTTTIFRPFPALTPEADHSNGFVWDPYRFTTEFNDFGDWMRMYPAVRGWGPQGITFLLYDPTDESAAMNPEDNPAWVFFRAIDGAVSSGQDRSGWYALLKGGNNRSAQLTKPSELYMMQGALFMHKNKPYNPPRGSADNDNVLILQHGPSGGEELCKRLDERIQDFRGDEDDWNAMYTHGDPVSLEHGAFLHWCQKGYANQQSQGAAQGGFGGARDGGGGGSGQSAQLYGYDCWITRECNGISASLAQFEQVVANKVLPWDRVVQILSYEEQAQMICGMFPPDAVMYAFGDRPEWLTDKVKDTAVDRSRAAGSDVPPSQGTSSEQQPRSDAAPQTQMMFGGASPSEGAQPQGEAPQGPSEDQGLPDGEVPETPAAAAAQPAAGPPAGRRRRQPPPQAQAAPEETQQPAEAATTEAPAESRKPAAKPSSPMGALARARNYAKKDK